MRRKTALRVALEIVVWLLSLVVIVPFDLVIVNT